MRLRTALLTVALVSTAGVFCGDSTARAQPRYHGQASAGVHVRSAPIAVGWYFGFGLTAAPLVRQSGGPGQLGPGGGYSLYGGIHVLPRASLELSWTSTFHDPEEVDTIWGPDVDYLVLDSLSVGGRLYVGNLESPVAPYILAGVGAYALSRPK